MGWVISVGQAGVKGKKTGAQALMLSVDVEGTAARVKVYRGPDAGLYTSTAAQPGALPAWQAQRVWQNVLSTLVGN